MKLKLILSLFAVLSVGPAFASPPDFRWVPNYMARNRCDPFSKDAVKFLSERGIPAHRILYRWRRIGEGCYGYHAAVLFKHGGKVYFMDNWREKPRLVGAKTDLGCVHVITGDSGVHCRMVDERGRRVEPRKLSELFGE